MYLIQILINKKFIEYYKENGDKWMKIYQIFILPL